MKKFHIITYGCQMNVYDSSRISDILILNNFQQTDILEESDVIIMNTCHIRDKASEKIFSELGKLKKYKKKKIDNNEYCVIVLAGCVAVAKGKDIFKRMPIVDIVVGGESYHKIDKMILEVFNKKEKLINIDFQTKEKFESLPYNRIVKNISENVAIQSGCDKFCSYCVVPYTRGREYSRSIEEIISEIKVLVDKGIKEIILLGQNVDSYHGINKNGKQSSLADLIYKINEFDQIKRIRYVTSYPSEFSDEMIKAHKNLEKLMPFIHLPVQSGSNRILKLMNRKYTKEFFIDLVYKIKDDVKNIAISSDFIVGFPDETDKDFQETIDLVEKVNFASSYSFKYSQRPNTIAYKMQNQIPESIKQNRLNILQKLLNQQQFDFNKTFLNQEMEILIENNTTKKNNFVFGRTKYFQAVLFKNNKNLKSGDFTKVLITKTDIKTLQGI